MKTCPNCANQLPDDAVFCGNCGTQFAQQAYAQQSYSQQGYAQQQAYYQQSAYQPPVPAYDHTADFTAEDISENKVISMLVYLMGWIGIVIALLAANTSKYAAFHVRQALKFVVVETLIPIALVVGTIINVIPFLGTIIYICAAIAAGVIAVIFFVLKIICFFQICKGKAVEPAIIRSLKFLK